MAYNQEIIVEQNQLQILLPGEKERWNNSKGKQIQNQHRGEYGISRNISEELWGASMNLFKQK